MPTGTGTIKFIRRSDMPNDRKATYGRIVVSVRHAKVGAVTYKINGRRKLDRLSRRQVHTDSRPDDSKAFVQCSSIDAQRQIHDDRHQGLLLEYVHGASRVHAATSKNYTGRDSTTIQDRQHRYQRHSIHRNMQRNVWFAASGKLANEQLQQHLATFGYRPTANTPGLWKHDTRSTIFSLVVDDFGILYTSDDDALHLQRALESKYKITIDRAGTLYCGLTLQWDYRQRTVQLSMPGYVANAIHKFCQNKPTAIQHAPHKCIAPVYGRTTSQLPIQNDDSTRLTNTETKHVQQVVGTLLYYARAVDPTMLVALGTIAEQQSKATVKTMEAVTNLLNYAATHPDAVIQYNKSDMTLHVDSDASYMSMPEARSRAGGFFYLSTTSKPANLAPVSQPPLNGAVHVLCCRIRNVMASAAEAEVGALYENGQEVAAMRNTLLDMGFKQPPTAIKTDNSTAVGIVNNTMKQRKSRAIDMRFYWLRDRIAQNQFIIYWKPGKENYADYFTKHHPIAHHKTMRSTYLKETRNEEINNVYTNVTQTKLLTTLQGCIDILTRSARNRASHDTSAYVTLATPARIATYISDTAKDSNYNEQMHEHTVY